MKTPLQDSVHVPVAHHKHDPHKLKKKAPHAQGRVYNLKETCSSSDDVETVEAAPELPTSVDLREKAYIPPVLDQGSLGSCASNAMANNIAFLMGKEGFVEMHPSRLALYYNCRVQVEGEPADQDTGVTIGDICKSVQEFHACPESDWPYDITKFSQPPPPKAVADEQKHKQFKFVSVPQDETSIKTCLAQGFPVILGIQVYTSFESEAVAETGLVPIPDTQKEQCLGGHAQCLYGYNDDKQAFLSMNSWGPWGINQSGFSWIPYDYICNPDLCQDIWCVRYFD